MESKQLQAMYGRVPRLQTYTTQERAPQKERPTAQQGRQDATPAVVSISVGAQGRLRLAAIDQASEAQTDDATSKQEVHAGGSDHEQVNEEVARLRQKESRVRSKELARAMLASGAMREQNFEYEVGPDGKRYVVGSEIEYDLSEINGDPEATVRKAERIKRAALANDRISAEDLVAALQAERLKGEALEELNEDTQQIRASPKPTDA